MTLAQACSVILHATAYPHMQPDPVCKIALHIVESTLYALYPPRATLATPRALFAALNRGTRIRPTTVETIYGPLNCLVWTVTPPTTFIYPALPADLIPDKYLHLYIRQVPHLITIR